MLTPTVEMLRVSAREVGTLNLDGEPWLIGYEMPDGRKYNVSKAPPAAHLTDGCWIAWPVEVGQNPMDEVRGFQADGQQVRILLAERFLFVEKSGEPMVKLNFRSVPDAREAMEFAAGFLAGVKNEIKAKPDAVSSFSEMEG